MMKRFVLLSMTVALTTLPAAAAPQSISDLHVTVVGRTNTVAGSPSETRLTFDGPVDVPGVGLAPGEYVFQMVAPSVMQVSSPDHSKTFATFFVMPTERPSATGDYAVNMARTGAGAPPRIEKLFVPDAREGYELLYPPMKSLPKPSN
jgi:hypothetical protein